MPSFGLQGKNQNWELADFEMHEIAETIGCNKRISNRKRRIKKVDMLKPSLDAVNDAIDQRKTPSLFNSSYLLLTSYM